MLLKQTEKSFQIQPLLKEFIGILSIRNLLQDFLKFFSMWMIYAWDNKYTATLLQSFCSFSKLFIVFGQDWSKEPWNGGCPVSMMGPGGLTTYGCKALREPFHR